MALESNDRTISELITQKSFIVPTNQRKYVWRQTQWDEILSDIDLVYKSIKPDHFIGSVVLKTEKIDDGIREHYSIIDGQQRVLTISILFSAIGYLYAKNKYYNKLRGLKTYLIVIDRNGDSHPIISKEANKDVFSLVNNLIHESEIAEKNNLTIIEAELIAKNANVSKVIKECFLFFVKGLESRINSIQELDKYADIIESIRYINVKADTNEDAYTIFEVLNARGQELTDFDLLRNFLLKRSSQDNKDKVIEAIQKIEILLDIETENFLKHYVLHKYGIKTTGRKNRPYKVISIKEKAGDILRFVEDLLLKAYYYHQIITGEGCSRKIQRVYSFLRSHNQRQYRPLIMGLMHQKESRTLSIEEFELFNDYLYKFFICYKIIGEMASNKLDDIVEKYSPMIENDFNDNVLHELRKSLIKRLPNEKNFINSFKALNYSNHWKAYSGSVRKKKVFAVLEYLEEISGSVVEISDTVYNIEHILPDSESEANVSIGNLMLIEKPINDAVRNKSIKDKSKEYRKTNLREPLKVADEIDGDTFDINNRQDYMAKKIYTEISKLCD